MVFSSLPLINRCETLGLSEIIQGFDSLIPYSYDLLSYARGVITWIIRDVCHQLPRPRGLTLPVAMGNETDKVRPRTHLYPCNYSNMRGIAETSGA